MDAAQRLRQLQQEAGSLIRPPGSAIGTDSTGLVEVGIDAGGRLTEIEIHRDWFRGIAAEQLGRAVVEAAVNAVTNRAVAWARDAATPVNRPVPDGRHESRERPDPRAVSRENRGAALHGLMDLLNGAIAETEAATEQLEALAQRAITEQSATGRVTATITGSQLTDVEIQIRWLRLGPTGREIADEIQVACRRAYQTAAELAAQVAAQTPRVDAVRALGNDPQELIRRLGLG